LLGRIEPENQIQLLMKYQINDYIIIIVILAEKINDFNPTIISIEFLNEINN